MDYLLIDHKLYSKTYTAIQQLDNVIADANNCIEYKLNFLGFITIAIGIELLGGISIGDIESDKRSHTRFDNAFKNLFVKNKLYAKHSTDLYTLFRCGILHQYRPVQGIELTHNQQERHLKKSKGVLVLDLTQFLEDFKLAKKELEKRLEKGQANRVVSTLNYMTTKDVQITNGNCICPSGYTDYDELGG